jgi:hypothetical protein
MSSDRPSRAPAKYPSNPPDGGAIDADGSDGELDEGDTSELQYACRRGEITGSDEHLVPAFS